MELDISDAELHISDAETADPDGELPVFRPASLFQPQPVLVPPTGDLPQRVPLPSAAEALTARMASRRRATVGIHRLNPGLQSLTGLEATPRAAEDAGSLLGKWPMGLGISVQKRNPDVNEPRLHSNAVGTLQASGSYWLPARLDLDTVLSKIDARDLEQIDTINGPYGVCYGPDYKFIDFTWLPSPRSDEGYETAASTGLEYHSNSRQFYGRQTLSGCAEDWGFRVAYGHRTANDYETGAGLAMPAGYNTGNLSAAFGFDLDDRQTLEFNFLRLDQTGVELPGQAFDLNYLATTGASVRYTLVNQPCFDELDLDAWYNETRLAGDNLGPGKRAMFPFFELTDFRSYTDVSSVSDGFRLSCAWGEGGDLRFTAGMDLRAVTQELNEISSGWFPPDTTYTDVNSPIPRSFWLDPGLFVQQVLPVSDQIVVTAGARLDWVTTDVTADLTAMDAQRQSQGLPTIGQILGTSDYQQSFLPWSAYVTGRWDVSDQCSVLAGAGQAMRPPNLTELYAAEPFMFLLQNGQNTITGDPLLKPERVWQVDLGLTYQADTWQAGVQGFHAWLFDYITFENMYQYKSTVVEQVDLRYVNTAQATKWGLEGYAAWEVTPWLAAFGNLSYLVGSDQTRNGQFATKKANGSNPTERVYGLPRGYFSGVTGNPQEPLPAIFPLESRWGLRWHEPQPAQRWTLEVSVRLVAPQGRVAASLQESSTSGFAVGDLRGSWRVTPRALLVAGVENFTNTNYREHLDYRSPNGLAVYQPGTNVYTGTEINY